MKLVNNEIKNCEKFLNIFNLFKSATKSINYYFSLSNYNSTEFSPSSFVRKSSSNYLKQEVYKKERRLQACSIDTSTTRAL